MSVPRFSVEEQTPRGLKYNLAMRIINDVVPTIMSINEPLSRRISLGFSWYVFLTEAAPGICREYCGEGLGDPEKWGAVELEKIARSLATYASSLMKEVLVINSKGGTRAPRPPR